MPLTVLPLTPERMPDLDAVFQARGCSVAKNCYCMYYRRSGKATDLKPGETRSSRSRTEIARLAEGDMPPGLLGYKDGKAVGWVSLGPRADFVRLANSQTMRRVDAQPVWSIICFVVPSEYRKQGVAHDLLAAAVDFARARGATLLEAYPVDRKAPGAPSAPWFGSSSMFTKAGFVEVARHRPARPVVRLEVAGAGRAVASSMEPVEMRSDTRSRLLAASPSQVFAAMSDPARVARWWGPAGFTNSIHQFDFRPGGTWRLTMHGPDGKDYPNESRFTRIVADRVFEIEHLGGHHFLLTIELVPVRGGTDVRWQQTFDTVEHYEKIAEFVAAANEQNLERLADEVRHGKSGA